MVQALAEETEMKRSQGAKIIDSLTKIATAVVENAGKLTVPRLCMFKTCVKPATTIGKQAVFGKTTRGRRQRQRSAGRV